MRGVGILIGLALLLAAVPSDAGGSPSAAVAAKPDVVVVLTDDMRAADWAMLPKTQRLVGDAGTTFPNFFLTTPVCCPSRSSILTGEYAHNHGVQTNNAGWDAFRPLEGKSLPSWLAQAGYRTGLFGKYLNGYGFTSGHVPPDWDRWYSTNSRDYFDYDLNENGKDVHYGGGAKDYLTDVLDRKAVGFIKETKAGTPLFAYVAVKAPHGPATPAPRDQGSCAGASVARGPSFDEADVSDKPAFIQDAPLTDKEIAALDALEADRACSLKPVDDLVGDVVGALKETGRLDNAYLFVLSDNGYLMGEHRLSGKGVAYEEAVRVPMLVRGPRFAAGATDGRLAANIDLAPTIADVAGAKPRLPVDGRSLLSDDRRSAILLERIKGADDGDGEGRPVPHGTDERSGHTPSFSAIRTADAVYVEYEDGERELYDLAADPLQLANLAADPGRAGEIGDLAGRLDALRGCAGDACRAADGGGTRGAKVGGGKGAAHRSHHRKPKAAGGKQQRPAASGGAASPDRPRPHRQRQRPDRPPRRSGHASHHGHHRHHHSPRRGG